MFAQGGEPMGRKPGKMASRFDDGAEDGAAEGDFAAFELGLEEAVVEAGAVGHEDGLANKLAEFRGDLGETRGLADHGIGDAGELADEGGNAALRIHEARPFPDDAPPAHPDRTDLGEAVAGGITSGGLDIDDDIVLSGIDDPLDPGHLDAETGPAQTLDLHELLTPELVALRLQFNEAEPVLVEHDEIGKPAPVRPEIPGHFTEDGGQAASGSMIDEPPGPPEKGIIPGHEGIGDSGVRLPDRFEECGRQRWIVEQGEAGFDGIAPLPEEYPRAKILRREVKWIMERGVFGAEEEVPEKQPEQLQPDPVLDVGGFVAVTGQA